MNDDDRGGTQSIGDILSKGVYGRRPAALTVQQKARETWLRSNGDLERKHTCGVFLKENATKDGLPLLVVYIDSSSMIQDFSTDKDLYIDRLRHAGFVVGDLRFKLSREKVVDKGIGTAVDEPLQPEPLPTLSKEEKAYVDSSVAALPDTIRESVREAMDSSLRWNKLQDTKKDDKPPQKC